MGLVTTFVSILDLRVLLLMVVIVWLLSIWMKRPNLPPGPWSFPLVGNIPYFVRCKMEFPDALVALSKTYGSVFTVMLGSQRTVVLTDFKSIYEAMHHPDFQDRPHQEQFKKEFFKLIGVPVPYGVTSSSGKTWHELRKFMVRNFRDFGIGKSSFEDVISTEASELEKALACKVGTEFDPMILLNYAMSNIVCSVTFGQRYEYGEEKFERLLGLVNRQFELLGIVTLLSTFPILLKIQYGPIKEVLQNGIGFHNFFSEIIDNHEMNFDENEIDDIIDSFTKDMRSAVENGYPNPEIFTSANLRGIVEDMFFAGVDSSATTVRWFLLFMVREPNIQEKFQEELDLVVGRSRLPKWSDKQSLPYVNACIYEAQRLGSPSALGGPHCTSKDTSLFGYSIPKGTLVLPNVYALMMDPQLWEEPEEFRPGRFLSSDGKVTKPEYFIPFNIGPRQCPGNQLANMELFIFITHLLHRFKFALPEGASLPSSKGKMGITFKAPPFKLIVTEREQR